jgi:hypothetical protein
MEYMILILWDFTLALQICAAAAAAAAAATSAAVCVVFASASPQAGLAPSP